MEKKTKKRIVVWSIVVAAIAIIVGSACVVLPKVDTAGYRNVIGNYAGSFFTRQTNDYVDELLEKTDGRVKGVCHPNENYEQIKGANIEWVRYDLTSIPYDDNGNETQGYKNFKARCKGYVDNGFKVMCVTQYPDVMIEAGYDPRTPAGVAKIKEYAAYEAQDLQGYVAGFQITNEMGIEHFTLPLTLKEAADYIGIQLEAMVPYKKDIICGFNLAGFTLYTLSDLMRPYVKYCDYVALDLYLGCFENLFKDLYWYDVILRFMWNFYKKPILINEFGYMGYGKLKTEEEKLAILQSYGASSEEDARKNIRAFIDKLPEDFKHHMLYETEWTTEEELAAKLFDTELVNHLYKEIQGGYQLTKYEHTPEDQAKFYTDVFKHFKKLKFLCGAIVYCYSDSDSCYICGQTDCPVETGWGLVDLNGNPKPCYYAIKEAFANWN